MNKRKFKNIEAERVFYNTLRKRVHSALEGVDFRTGKIHFWLKGLFWLVISYSAYYCLFITSNHMTFWSCFLVFQLAGLLVGFSFGHDASHHTAMKSKKANQTLHFFSFLAIGIDPLLWGLRHLRSHHLYANIEGSDIDIDKNPFLRLAPSHPWKPKHRYQHYYAPLVYMLALLHSVFKKDWMYLFSADYEWMKKGVNKTQLIIRFLLFKVMYFSLVLIIPMIFTNVSVLFVVMTYLTTSAFTSLVFVIMLVGTHFFYESTYYESESHELESSWAVHQLRTSCDWNPQSKLARYISGGSNCHAAHHLFPNICHTHYDKINDIIDQTTQEFGFPYHTKSLTKMMISHFKHLKRMGTMSLTV
jgi:linoleoyl-CoA desaturase